MNGIHHGILCLTFDDRNFADWLAAMPRFAAYGAHASFFVSGAIDGEAIAAMQTLHAAGHTVGIHTRDHADAPAYFDEHGAAAYYDEQLRPQLEACAAAGLAVRSFAYPNNRHNAETDADLAQYFDHFRVGLKDAAEGDIHIPVDELACHRLMHGMGIGSYYNTVESALCARITAAAEANTCITFFSHGIHENPNKISIAPDMLETVLRTASRCGMRILGLDELS